MLALGAGSPEYIAFVEEMGKQTKEMIEVNAVFSHFLSFDHVLLCQQFNALMREWTVQDYHVELEYSRQVAQQRKARYPMIIASLKPDHYLAL